MVMRERNSGKIVYGLYHRKHAKQNADGVCKILFRKRFTSRELCIFIEDNENSEEDMRSAASVLYDFRVSSNGACCFFFSVNFFGSPR